MITFDDAPAHFGKYFANQTLDWLPTDTKENYEEKIKNPKCREYFAKHGWDQPGAITYKFNSHGYRADEFDGGPYLMALGCSYTVGTGLPDYSTWARLTATALDLKCANLAWGGYSADTCYRLAEYWVPRLKPAYVCMLTPPRSRIELLLDSNSISSQDYPFEVFLPGSKSKWYSADDQYLKHWQLNEENSRINHCKNILAVRQLCGDLNIPCTVLDSDVHMCLSRDITGYARDYGHCGPNIHKILADKFIQNQ
jgi:hypothetical protein